MESTGSDNKIRGTAQQILDKYLALARDAYSCGDRIVSEGYFQYAEHYYRIIHASNGGDGQGGQSGQGQHNHPNRRDEGKPSHDDANKTVKADKTDKTDQPVAVEKASAPEPQPAPQPATTKTKAKANKTDKADPATA